MNFTPAQLEAIEIDESDLVVIAGAGSGKTRVLVERYLRLLSRYPPDRLLAITFTEKAAREMRERVRSGLAQRARATVGHERELWERRRAEIEGARIGTIHSFCAALLRAHPAETGLDPAFVVLDEVQSAIIRQEAVDTALAQAVVAGRGGAAMAEFDVGELRSLLTGLIAEGHAGRAAVEALPSDPAILLNRWHALYIQARAEALDALAGDLAWRTAAQIICALTELAPQGDRIGDQVLALIPDLVLFLTERPDVESAPQLIQRFTEINLIGGSPKAWGSPAILRETKQALQTLRERAKPCAELLAAEWDEAFERRVAQATLAIGELYHLAMRAFERSKLSIDQLDFDDLEARAVRLLQQHPDVRLFWREELAALLVDEFQDTNEPQRDLVYALAGFLEGDAADGRLFIVGDGKQSIYRFRGAEVAVFSEVRARIATRGRLVMLDISFRAHERLLTLFNQCFAAIMAREQPWPYEVPFERLQPSRPPSPHGRVAEIQLVPKSQRSLAGYATIEDVRRYEAQIVVARLRELIDSQEPIVYQPDTHRWRGARPGDIAVLCQASSMFEPYEEAMRLAGLPFQTTAGRGYYGRKEVRDLIHLLSFLQNPADDFALAGVLRSPLIAVDDATLLLLRLDNIGSLWHAMQQDNQALPLGQEQRATLQFARTVLEELLDLQGRITIVELLQIALERTGYLVAISLLPDGERRRVNVEKLIDTARATARQGLAHFTTYLEAVLRIEAREGEAPLDTGDAIRMMTVHRAKGLEFPIVILPDLGRPAPASSPTARTMPGIGLALKLRDTGEWQPGAAYRAAQIEDRRKERAERERLAYVALTRAQDYLIIAGAENTQSGDDWLSWIVASLGWPWEQGGPPPGEHMIADGALALRVDRAPTPFSE